jgi:hypothetical protein
VEGAESDPQPEEPRCAQQGSREVQLSPGRCESATFPPWGAASPLQKEVIYRAPAGCQADPLVRFRGSFQFPPGISLAVLPRAVFDWSGQARAIRLWGTAGRGREPPGYPRG